MPAVDPTRLEREIGEVLEAFADVAAFRRACLDLLGRYADRARRPGPATAADDSPAALGVPRPVVRSLQRALVGRARQQPEVARALAEALFQTGVREAQLVAVSLLAASLQAQPAPVVEAWAKATSDPVVRQALLDEALAAWRRQAPEAFLCQARLWLQQGRRGQTLALEALAAAARDANYHALPSLLDLLERAVEDVRGERRRALLTVVEALAERSPAEAAQFLLQGLARGRAGAQWLARHAMAAFPEVYRQRLRQGLSGS